MCLYVNVYAYVTLYITGYEWFLILGDLMLQREYLHLHPHIYADRDQEAGARG